MKIFCAALVLLLASPAFAGEMPTFPLDALTPDEITATVKILNAAGDVDVDTLYPTLTLREPSKDFVRSWKEGETFPRQAFVILHKAAKTFEAVVDLSASKVISFDEKPGVQPMVMDGEWAMARDLFMADPRFKAAIARRKLAAPDAVFCTPNSAGTFPSDGYDGKRILKIPCFTSDQKINPGFGRPIEGLMGVVDTDTKTVLDVIDDHVVDLAPPPRHYGADLSPLDRPLNAVAMITPAGPNIALSGNLTIKWANWSVHARADKRAGLILSRIQFQDGNQLRDVAYQMNIAEMFVPYMDPDQTWAYRTFMDEGEFGLGYTVSSLKPGVDCPLDAIYSDMVFPNDDGGSFARPNALCVFERASGDPAWRHYSSGRRDVTGVPQVELVVRHIPTVGNYDYVIDYVFTPQGAITLRVGATGFDAMKTVAAATTDQLAETDGKYGTLVAPYLVAPNHDHYFSFRLDMDVDGPQNSFFRDQYVMAPATGSKFRKSLWRLKTDQYAAEGPIETDHASPGGERFRIANPNMKSALGYNPGYMLSLGHDATSILAENDPPQKRAQFSGYSLWVTKEKPGEDWSSGLYPNLSTSDQGLPLYVKDQESLTNEDIVLWYTMGFRHAPRPEDFPLLPMTWHEMTLKPAFFFDHDPSMTFNPTLMQPQDPAPPPKRRKK